MQCLMEQNKVKSFVSSKVFSILIEAERLADSGANNGDDDD